MSDFIHNKQWLMPPFISLNYPASVDKIGQVPIPLYEDVDKAVWTNSTNGILSFKDAFLHVRPAGQSTHRRVIYNKMPIDEHLKSRDCVTVSMCSLCGTNEETSLHLFLYFPFAISLWTWLQGILGCNIDTSSFVHLLSVIDKSWSSQLKDISLDAVINIIWVI